MLAGGAAGRWTSAWQRSGHRLRGRRGGRRQPGALPPSSSSERVDVISQWVSPVTAVVAAVINLGALVFVGVQVRHVISESRRNASNQELERVRQRKRDTIDAVMATAQHHADLKAVLPWNDRDQEVVKRFLEEIEADDSKRNVVRKYLDYIELVAVGVMEDVFDLETVTRLSGERFIAVAKNYLPYMERRRRELNSPSLYVEIEVMADLIRAHQKKLSLTLTGSTTRSAG